MSFLEIQDFLSQLKPLLNVSEEELAVLRKPQNVLKANLNVAGNSYPAYRVQFNNARGPFKGGIRFHPEVSEDEVTSLSFWMSLKTALVDIPLGGGKGGITVNPKSLSVDELEQLAREYVRAFWQNLGSDKDIPAPDVYTTPQIMIWMLDEYEKLAGKKDPGMITGKPLDAGGSQLRDIATALGGVFVLEEVISHNNFLGRSVAIQGYGNAGYNVAHLLHKRGFKIIAISDSKGAIYNAEGFDLEKIDAAKRETGSVIGTENCEKISDILSVDADILIPAALGGSITVDNATSIKAKIILELANGPVTKDADEILFGNKIMVLPDILANAGGVTVSYFEWLQNNKDEKWSAEVVKQKLKDIMTKATKSLLEENNSFSGESSVNLRTTAYIIAIKRILQAEKERLT